MRQDGPCRACGRVWPCDTTRLLATLDAARSEAASSSPKSWIGDTDRDWLGNWLTDALDRCNARDNYGLPKRPADLGWMLAEELLNGGIIRAASSSLDREGLRCEFDCDACRQSCDELLGLCQLERGHDGPHDTLTAIPALDTEKESSNV